MKNPVNGSILIHLGVPYVYLTKFNMKSFILRANLEVLQISL